MVTRTRAQKGLTESEWTELGNLLKDAQGRGRRMKGLTGLFKIVAPKCSFAPDKMHVIEACKYFGIKLKNEVK